MYVFVYNTIKWYWYGRLVNWVLLSFTRSIHQRAHNNNTVKVRKVASPLGETQCTIHNSRDAGTFSAAIATRSRADCSCMDGHTSLSKALMKKYILVHVISTLLRVPHLFKRSHTSRVPHGWKRCKYARVAVSNNCFLYTCFFLGRYLSPFARFDGQYRIS